MSATAAWLPFFPSASRGWLPHALHSCTAVSNMFGLFGRQKRERVGAAKASPLRAEAQLGGHGLDGQRAGWGSSTSKRQRGAPSNDATAAAAAAAPPPPLPECCVSSPAGDVCVGETEDRCGCCAEL